MRSASAPAGSPKMRMGSPRAKMISPSACPVSEQLQREPREGELAKRLREREREVVRPQQREVPRLERRERLQREPPPPRARRRGRSCRYRRHGAPNIKWTRRRSQRRKLSRLTSSTMSPCSYAKTERSLSKFAQVRSRRSVRLLGSSVSYGFSSALRLKRPVVRNKPLSAPRPMPSTRGSHESHQDPYRACVALGLEDDLERDKVDAQDACSVDPAVPRTTSDLNLREPALRRIRRQSRSNAVGGISLRIESSVSCHSSPPSGSPVGSSSSVVSGPSHCAIGRRVFRIGLRSLGLLSEIPLPTDCEFRGTAP